MFPVHKLNERGFEAVEKFKQLISNAAIEAMNEMPEGRDKAIFMTKLDEAMFFGTRAIASHEIMHEQVKSFPIPQQLAGK